MSNTDQTKHKGEPRRLQRQFSSLWKISSTVTFARAYMEWTRYLLVSFSNESNDLPPCNVWSCILVGIANSIGRKYLLLSFNNESNDLLHCKACSYVGIVKCIGREQLGTNAVSVFRRRRNWNFLFIFLNALLNKWRDNAIDNNHLTEDYRVHIL